MEPGARARGVRKGAGRASGGRGALTSGGRRAGVSLVGGLANHNVLLVEICENFPGVAKVVLRP
jgi:hypothetical protein